MIEAGISLVAANLPTLRFLVRKWSFEAFSQYIGSFVSLDALRSRRSQDLNVKLDDQHIHFAPSRDPVKKSVQIGVPETHAVGDIESQNERRRGLVFF